MSGKVAVVDKLKQKKWRIVAKSVRGALHVRTGQPNQDAMLWRDLSDSDEALVVAISDGHGSASCFRSDKGAFMAVSAAVKVAKKNVKLLPQSPDISIIEDLLKKELPQRIVHFWRDTVADDICKYPFEIVELQKVEIEGITKRRQVSLNPVIAYGATLMTVIIAKSLLIILQIGDGDILLVSEKGRVNRPFPRDPRLIANETTSLCMNEAWREFQVRILPMFDVEPALIMLATDGYANAFCSEDDFLQVGSDFWEIINSDGLDAIEANLKQWLLETSQEGSGDDITVAIVSSHINSMTDKVIIGE